MASDWFSRFEGAGLDGVVAKSADLHYLPDKRVNARRSNTSARLTASWPASAPTRTARGSDRSSWASSTTLGTLHHVGVASGFSVARRRELVDEVKPYRKERPERTTPGRAGPRRRRRAARRAR